MGSDVADRGLVAGNWYVDGDRDDIVLVPPGSARLTVRRASRLLEAGYGADAVPDLLAVVLEGGLRRLDAALAALVTEARRASGGRALVVVTSTGSIGDVPDAVPASRVEEEIEDRVGGRDVVEATAVGGVFVDQQLLGQTGLSEDRVTAALRRIEGSTRGALFADAFPGIAITFARYC